MARIRLVHWKTGGALPYVEALKKSRHALEYAETQGPEIMRAIKQSPPDAIVIDLSAKPWHGRELGVALRSVKATRAIPLIYCEGEREKVESVKNHLPDAEFTTRSKLGAVLGRVLKHPPSDPIRPTPMMERYTDRDAAQKLGIAKGTKVAVMSLPRQSPAVLNRLPAEVELMEDDMKDCAVALFFATDRKALLDAIQAIRDYEGRAKTWILWRKKAVEGRKADLSQELIREQAAELGLVDYKICSADELWSAMLFTRRRDH